MGDGAIFGFNPRARAGRDPARGDAGDAGHVSIHAPARGATAVEGEEGVVFVVSIHAPARGATCRRRPIRSCAGWFQSTRPRGARREGAAAALRDLSVSIHAPARGATGRCGRSAPRPVCFNPRARAGRDVKYMAKKEAKIEFQSTRPRGARLERVDHRKWDGEFQSTRPRGARPTVIRAAQPQ